MLELQHVTAGYQRHTVVRDVSLVVPDESVVALLGPNGAGKTTLLRVASGQLVPNAGRIVLDGEDVTGWPTDAVARAGVCHVPEGRGVFPGLTVRDNLRLQAPVHLEHSVIETAASIFPRLGQRLDQLAGTLSGGEQQMLALAHAFVAEPSVVLVDEVSMGLAPKIVDEIFDRLHHLARTGTSLLLVEQYVTRALDLADYVYVLRKGAIDLVAEPRSIDADTLLASYVGAAS